MSVQRIKLERIAPASLLQPLPRKVRMNWIDITKELPALGTPVLVKWRGGGVTAAMPRQPWHGNKFKIEFDTYGVIGPDRDWEWDDAGDPFLGVTHWMPMPAAPGESR